MSDSDMDDNLLDQELIDDLQNADDLLGELQKEEAAPPARTSKSTVRWRKRDIDENVLYARPRSHRNQSEEVGHDQIPNPPCDTADHGTNSEVAFAPETASKTISAAGTTKPTAFTTGIPCVLVSSSHYLQPVALWIMLLHTVVTGRGICGGEWLAAQETSYRSRSKVDEEGLELAVCGHGVLLAALNMFRGEIYAYPMFLQNQLVPKHDITFFCMDVACKYWPYLQRVCSDCPELQSLQNMRPFLSVLHAKAHDFKCEVGNNVKSQKVIKGKNNYIPE
ncbi:uncharacterized protein LOC114567259 isoform X3 [Perca flavescens]|uniref:uncharacterized protein LOC114567259 isoform X3 n=1 Tax=Perca flavescens TaxID=8167 RepID=UPI00106EC257|nr:uncharacterized protein LOC114567259 isoform X3 [Perca flavescens]